MLPCNILWADPSLAHAAVTAATWTCLWYGRMVLSCHMSPCLPGDRSSQEKSSPSHTANPRQASNPVACSVPRLHECTCIAGRVCRLSGLVRACLLSHLTFLPGEALGIGIQRSAPIVKPSDGCMPWVLTRNHQHLCK